MASITGMLPDSVIVLRDGQQTQIDGRNVVPGDLLRITLGNKLPADVRFIEVSPDARFDRSILTGETLPLLGSVDSTDDNYLETACIGMAGTHCVAGNAWGLIVETGDRTVFGRIAKLTSTPKTGLTPLQKEILIFVGIICALMLTMVRGDLTSLSLVHPWTNNCSDRASHHRLGLMASQSPPRLDLGARSHSRLRFCGSCIHSRRSSHRRDSQSDDHCEHHEEQQGFVQVLEDC
jgi:hypothetical protein